MNTSGLLFMFGLILPITLICPPGKRMFTRKYYFWVSCFTRQSWLIPVSRSRGLLSPLLRDVVIGLLLINVTHYIPFILPDAPHKTDYSQSEGNQKKLHFTIINFFPKRLSRNQEINQPIYLCQYVGWGCADHPFPTIKFVLIAFIKGTLFALTSRLPWFLRLDSQNKNKQCNEFSILVHCVDLHFRLSMLLH